MKQILTPAARRNAAVIAESMPAAAAADKSALFRAAHAAARAVRAEYPAANYSVTFAAALKLAYAGALDYVTPAAILDCMIAAAETARAARAAENAAAAAENAARFCDKYAAPAALEYAAAARRYANAARALANAAAAAAPRGFKALVSMYSAAALEHAAAARAAAEKAGALASENAALVWYAMSDGARVDMVSRIVYRARQKDSAGCFSDGTPRASVMQWIESADDYAAVVNAVFERMPRALANNARRDDPRALAVLVSYAVYNAARKIMRDIIRNPHTDDDSMEYIHAAAAEKRPCENGRGVTLYDIMNTAGNDDIDKRIILMRAARGMTQEECADAIGMSQRAVSKRLTRALDRYAGE